MPDPVTEVVLAEADLDALVSPTSSDVWREMHGHSTEAVAAIAAKLAKGGGGGSLPSWWTVDSTSGSEDVTFAGAVEIEPGYDAEALVVRTNLDPGAFQTTLPFQFYDEDGLLAANFDSQGIFDARHIAVQNPPDTGADGGSVVIRANGSMSIVPRDSSVDGLDVKNAALQTLLLVKHTGFGSLLELSPRDNDDTAFLIVSTAAPTVDAIQIWDNGFNNTIFAVTATGGLKPTLPTANPGAGILWNDAGTVKVGT